MKNIILPASVLFTLLFFWEAIVRLVRIPLYVLPAPSSIFMALFKDWKILLFHSTVTLLETFIGLAIAIGLAVILAILMDAFQNFKAAIYPLLVLSQTIPVIVLAPIFIIYFGFGMTPKIIIVVLMCFFPIVVNFADGLKEVDENIVNLILSYGANKLQIYSIVKIPASIPSLLSGLRIAATYSITGAVVGEWLSAQSGLGYYMLRVKNGYMLDKVFACVVVIVILSLLMNFLVNLTLRRGKK
ncbi:MAG: ABC transporter permease [Clostridia bacterium]